jgi:hypothetical protein
VCQRTSVRPSWEITWRRHHMGQASHKSQRAAANNPAVKTGMKTKLVQPGASTSSTWDEATPARECACCSRRQTGRRKAEGPARWRLRSRCSVRSVVCGPYRREDCKRFCTPSKVLGAIGVWNVDTAPNTARRVDTPCTQLPNLHVVSEAFIKARDGWMNTL